MNFAGELFLNAFAMMIAIVVTGYIVSRILTSIWGDK